MVDDAQPKARGQARSSGGGGGGGRHRIHRSVAKAWTHSYACIAVAGDLQKSQVCLAARAGYGCRWLVLWEALTCIKPRQAQKGTAVRSFTFRDVSTIFSACRCHAQRTAVQEQVYDCRGGAPQRKHLSWDYRLLKVLYGSRRCPTPRTAARRATLRMRRRSAARAWPSVRPLCRRC